MCVFKMGLPLTLTDNVKFLYWFFDPLFYFHYLEGGGGGGNYGTRDEHNGWNYKDREELTVT